MDGFKLFTCQTVTDNVAMDMDNDFANWNTDKRHIFICAKLIFLLTHKCYTTIIMNYYTDYYLIISLLIIHSKLS